MQGYEKLKSLAMRGKRHLFPGGLFYVFFIALVASGWMLLLFSDSAKAGMPSGDGVISVEQSIFRAYQSSPSITPGNPLAPTNTPATLGNIADQFRTRIGLTNLAKEMIDVKSISTSSFDYTHSCALGADNRAYCWGSGSSGQLGYGNTASFQTPVAVRTDGVMTGLTLKLVKAGYQYSCALASNNKAYCWGNGANGKLGNGSNSNSNNPVAVSGGAMGTKTIKKLSTGGYQHSCAIASDDKVYCWGSNAQGQLGNGTTTSSNVPVAVDMTGVLSGLTARDIDVGFGATCIIASNNNAYCWGYNIGGMLGNNDGTNTSQSRPVAVTKASGGLVGKTVLSISVGSSHTCAIASDNNAYCWGYNGSGMIGDATTGGSHVVPTAVSKSGYLSDKTVKQISAGANVTCAIASDDQVYCWGNNELGRLGDGSTTNSNVPIKSDYMNVLGSVGIQELSVGYRGACVLTVNSIIHCWGGNSDGQLGNNTSTDSLIPVSLSMGEMSNPQATISTGLSFTCATASGKAYCWGDNTSGKLGDGSSTQRTVPTAVSTSNGMLAGKTIQSISAGDGHGCVVADGKAYCWGLNGASRLGFPSPPAQSSVPVAVTAAPGILAGKTVQSISAGAAHTCALADSGVYCWGLNTYGRLGDGGTTTQTTPVAINTGDLAGKSVQSVSTSNLHTCAVAEGKAYCWGRNNYRQVGDNTTAAERLTPVVIDTGGLAGKIVQSISTGSFHTCAVADGKAYCWGRNDDGQLGDDSNTTAISPVAVDTAGVLAGKTIESVSAGNTYTCATTSEGKAYCWGYGSSGELGAGAGSLQSLVPLAIDTSTALVGKTVQSISASRYGHTCVIASDNEAYCFGDNVNGQLGDGTTTNSAVPKAVNDSGVFAVTPAFVPSFNARLQLQFVRKSGYATCSAVPNGLWNAVTSVSEISYDDAGPNNEAVIFPFANDPTIPINSTGFNYQSVVRGGATSPHTFTNRETISAGKTGLWDFALRDRSARSNTTYCLRIMADPSASPAQNIDVYSTFSEFTTATGSLGIQFVDDSNTPIINPTTEFTGTASITAIQTTSGVLANSSTRRLEISNNFSNTGWSVTLAATGGPTATWQSGANNYRYNGTAVTGQLSVNTAASSFAASGTTPGGSACNTTGLSIGSSASFDASTPIISLGSGSSLSGFNCIFRLSTINLDQVVPAGQAGGIYTLPMTATVMAQ